MESVGRVLLSGREDKSCLQHGSRISDVEDHARVSSAAWILVVNANCAVVVQRPFVFWIDQPLVFELHQLLHDREHVDLARIDETFNVSVIRHNNGRIAIVDVVDAISGAEVAADLNRIVPRFPRYSAVKGNTVGWAVHDADQMFPSVDCSHDLSGAPADSYRRIVRMQCQAHTRLLGNWNDRLQEIRDVVPHFIKSVYAFFGQWRQAFDPIYIKSRQSRSPRPSTS